MKPMLITLAGLAYVAALILLTNAATGLGVSHRYLRVLQAAMPFVLAIQVLSRISASYVNDMLGLSQVLIACTSITFMMLLICFEKPWLQVERLIRFSGLVAMPEFDSRRPVHRLAFLLIIFALAVLFWRYSAEGGLQDLLDAYGTTSAALLNLAVDATVYVLLALLGVGWLVRRDWAATSERLGLRFPTRMDLLVGIVLGCFLYVGVYLATSVWQSMVPASTFEWQTNAARQIFDSFDRSLVFGALVALLAAIGEEILFRGALQPVFGVVIVSLIFTAIHLQYAFTPAAAIVFVISLSFGLARACLSTTAAIVSHFVYNLIPFLLASPV